MFEQHRNAVATRIPAMRTHLASSMMIAAAVLLLAACGGQSGSATGTSSKTSTAGTANAASTTGTTSTATVTTSGGSPAAADQTVSALNGGFRTVIPKGYRNALHASATNAKGTEYLAIGPKVGGSGSSLTVFRAAASGSDVAALAGRALHNLRSRASFLPKARGISSLQSLSVDGEPALAVSYRTIGLKTRRFHQLFVVHGTGAYEISDSSGTAGYAASLRALDDVIRSWRWE
jgi:hypothetical protein